MEKYKNKSGKSGIDEYQISDTAIKIKFVNSPILNREIKSVLPKAE